MDDDDTWLTLGEAAARTGWKPERIRSLARRGTMARKRGNGRDWLYQVTAELIAARVRMAAGPTAGTDDATRWQAAVTDLQEEIAELRIELARAEERAAAGDRIAVAELSAKETVIAELRASLAEARRPWWQRLLGSVSPASYTSQGSPNGQ